MSNKSLVSAWTKVCFHHESLFPVLLVILLHLVEKEKKKIMHQDPTLPPCVTCFFFVVFHLEVTERGLKNKFSCLCAPFTVAAVYSKPVNTAITSQSSSFSCVRL